MLAVVLWSVQTADAASHTGTSPAQVEHLQATDSDPAQPGDESDWGVDCGACVCHVFHHVAFGEPQSLPHPDRREIFIAAFEESVGCFNEAPPVRPPLV